MPFKVNRVGVTFFARDGSRIAALGMDAQARVASPFIYDPQHHTAVQLPNLGNTLGVDWIADDSVVVLLANYDLYVERAGSGAPQRVGTLGGWTDAVYMSASWPWLVLDGVRSSAPSGTHAIGVVHRDRSPACGATDLPAIMRAPRFPDRRLAVRRGGNGRTQVHVAMFPSMSENIVVSAESNVGGQRWSRDGSLYYVDRSGAVTAVSFREGPLRVASRRDAGKLSADVRAFDVSPDGKRFVYATDAGLASGPRLVVTLNAVR